MTLILCAGIATQDQVFRVAEMPARPEKHRASALAITTGGTAANAAVALAHLGAEVVFWGGLGDDGLGDTILAALGAKGIDVSGVRRWPGIASPLSAILVDDRAERTVISYADRRLPGPPDGLPRALPPGTRAVLGDTRWQAGSAHVFRLAREAGIPAVLDADRAPTEIPEVLELATHVAFATQALRDLTGIAEPGRALATLADRAGTWFAVTNGPEGVHHLEGGRVVHNAAFPVAAVDTLGAGDTWHGAFTLRLAEGAPEAEAIRFACAAAAIKCTRLGGCDGAPSRGEVEALLAGGPGRG